LLAPSARLRLGREVAPARHAPHRHTHRVLRLALGLHPHGKASGLVAESRPPVALLEERLPTLGEPERFCAAASRMRERHACSRAELRLSLESDLACHASSSPFGPWQRMTCLRWPHWSQSESFLLAVVAAAIDGVS
jgi:hypothetical protein